MRRPVLIVVAVLVVVVLAGVVSGVALLTARPGPSASASATAAESAWPTPAAIRWQRCDAADLRQIGARCAAVKVPRDWSSPRDGRTVTLALSRVEHTAQAFAGVILANPGGPGASGLGLAALGSSVPDGVGARYDWIGFDPRGVGASTPRLSCDADYASGPRPAYTPATAASIAAWRARSAAYATACGEKYGDLLAHMTTRDSVNDLEYLRIALRVDKISFYGFSYGTYLGEVYATLHPGRVARMVLDSTVDPRSVWYRANLEQDVAFDVVIRRWFDWIADHDSTYGLGTTTAQVERRFAAVSAGLRSTPDAVFGAAEWEDTVLNAGYSQGLWAPLAEAFSDAALAKDHSRAEAIWRGLKDPDDNGYAVYLAVQCSDATWPTDWATWERDTRETAAGSPYGTWLNTWFNAPCLTWPVQGGTPVEVDGADAPPILMIDQTLDAATPFAGSIEVRRRFPKASLLALPGGTSHAESLNGDACVDDAVARYLDDGSLPTRRTDRSYDATCAAPPLPTP